jgi:hypothetical protein
MLNQDTWLFIPGDLQIMQEIRNKISFTFKKSNLKYELVLPFWKARHYKEAVAFKNKCDNR